MKRREELVLRVLMVVANLLAFGSPFVKEMEALSNEISTARYDLRKEAAEEAAGE